MDRLTLSEVSQKLDSGLDTDTLALIVFHGLAGDCMYVSLPSKKNILIDCGFHKGNYITDAISKLPGELTNIVITHQHLDHFATLGNFIYKFSLNNNSILHSGISYPKGVVPHHHLTTCNDYEGLEIPLWHQYTNFIENNLRWENIETECKHTEIVNLLPQKADTSILSQHYGALNYSSTPVGIKHYDYRIIIGSDINSDQFNDILDSDLSSYLDNAELYIPASHGRPHHNPKWVLDKLNPNFICLNDSFPDSDFRGYYKDILPDSDIRSCNIDQSQVYIFTPDSVVRFGLNFETEEVAVA